MGLPAIARWARHTQVPDRVGATARQGNNMVRMTLTLRCHTTTPVASNLGCATHPAGKTSARLLVPERGSAFDRTAVRGVRCGDGLALLWMLSDPSIRVCLTALGVCLNPPRHTSYDALAIRCIMLAPTLVSAHRILRDPLSRSAFIWVGILAVARFPCSANALNTPTVAPYIAWRHVAVTARCVRHPRVWLFTHLVASLQRWPRRGCHEWHPVRIRTLGSVR